MTSSLEALLAAAIAPFAYALDGGSAFLQSLAQDRESKEAEKQRLRDADGANTGIQNTRSHQHR